MRNGHTFYSLETHALSNSWVGLRNNRNTLTTHACLHTTYSAPSGEISGLSTKSVTELQGLIFSKFAQLLKTSELLVCILNQQS